MTANCLFHSRIMAALVFELNIEAVSIHLNLIIQKKLLYLFFILLYRAGSLIIITLRIPLSFESY